MLLNGQKNIIIERQNKFNTKTEESMRLSTRLQELREKSNYYSHTKSSEFKLNGIVPVIKKNELKNRKELNQTMDNF